MLMLNTTALPVHRQFAATARGAVGRLARWCARCHARHEQRRHLAELDERMLRDVGLTPAEAARECAKPWWRG